MGPVAPSAADGASLVLECPMDLVIRISWVSEVLVHDILGEFLFSFF